MTIYHRYSQGWQHRWGVIATLMAMELTALGLVPLSAGAQLIPDDTLGDDSSLVNQNVQVRGESAERIDGGAIRGSNLFHSFSDFNVNEQQRVYFANPAGIDLILNRVTGNDVSDIMGTLGVDGDASLFLLNPNGIIFGQNARLDVTGSFTASTADSILFPAGDEFSATNPGNVSLLSVGIPLGVQYGPNAPRDITNEATLSVGQDFSLSGGNIVSTGLLSAPLGELVLMGVAGDVQIQNASAQTATFSASNNLILRDSQIQTIADLRLLAGNTVQMRDSIANPLIVYAVGDLLVQGNQNIDIFALNHTSSGLVSGEDMVLRSANAVGGDAHYWSGGSFQIEQLDGSLGELFSPYDPIVRAAGDVNFSSYDGNSLHILAGGEVNIPGTIIIRGVETGDADTAQGIGIVDPNTGFLVEPNIPLSFNESISINGGAVPTLDIRAGIDWAQLGGLNNPTTPNLPPGAIAPTAPPPPSSFPASATSANIQVGNIFNLSGAATGAGQTYLTNQYSPSSIGQNNSIQAGQILVYGDVVIDSQHDIQVNGNIDTSTTVGNQTAGSIKLLAPNGGITLNGDILSQIGQSRTSSLTGIAGSVSLLANGDIQISNIDANSNNSTIPGFNVLLRIDSERGSVTLNGSEILAENRGNQRAGVIDIDAGNKILLENSSKISTDGFDGRIFLEANDIEINDSQITAIEDEGLNLAGIIVIDAANEILLENNSNISTDGIDGLIFIGTDFGRIDPLGPQSVTINKSQITSTEDTGSGIAGDISIGASGDISVIASRIETIGDRGEILLGPNGDNLNVPLPQNIFITEGSAIISENRVPLLDEEIEIISNDGIPMAPEGDDRSRSGSISLQANQEINIESASLLRTSNIGRSGPGGISLETAQADGSIALNASVLSSDNSSIAEGGSISIATNELSLENAATVQATSLGVTGAGGSITIDANSIDLIGGSDSFELGTSTGLFANSLRFKDINAIEDFTIRDIIQSAQATSANNAGNGGDIIISTSESLVVENGAEINVGSFPSSDAIFDPGLGDAGSLTINTANLTVGSEVSEASEITVSSGQEAGNLNITAEWIHLDNGKLTAIAGVGDGANIDITLEGPLLLMRNGSEISAGAEGQGSGGNLSIRALDGFILADPNDNDILANAEEGSGGRIEITTNSVFGLEERSSLTRFSDINASSDVDLDGTIVLDTLNIDPTRGLEELPINFVDASNLVVEGCVGSGFRGVEAQSEFTRTGRGGISSDPTGVLTDESLIDQSALPNGDNLTDSSSHDQTAEPETLVEAQGLGRNASGQVSLVVSSDTPASPSSLVSPPDACDAT